jgi:hypothetical protein
LAALADRRRSRNSLLPVSNDVVSNYLLDDIHFSFYNDHKSPFIAFDNRV